MAPDPRLTETSYTKNVGKDQIERLVDLATEARGNAYAPYSGFLVGAAVLGNSGKMYAGCNVENASYGLTICAERVAIGNAVCAGERKLTAIAIVSHSPEPVPPCGACLQVIAEFGNPTIVSTTLDGQRQLWRLSDLMPSCFALPSASSRVSASLEPSHD